jgi:RHS repeat-associated protein
VHTGFDAAYRYTGKELDKATGLMYYEARYYDPVVGRFVSVDPYVAEIDSIDIHQSPQVLRYNGTYLYVGNSPVNGTDPSGMRGHFRVFGPHHKVVEQAKLRKEGVKALWKHNRSRLVIKGVGNMVAGALAVTGGVALAPTAPTGLGAVASAGAIAGGASTVGLGFTQIALAFAVKENEVIKAEKNTGKGLTVAKAAAWDTSYWASRAAVESARAAGATEKSAKLYGEFVGSVFGWLPTVKSLKEFPINSTKLDKISLGMDLKGRFGDAENLAKAYSSAIAERKAKRKATSQGATTRDIHSRKSFTDSSDFPWTGYTE